MEATITKLHSRLFFLLKVNSLRWYMAFMLFLPLVFSPQKSHASHMMGADITYRCIDTLKFEVTIKWYRDCRGIPLNGPNLRVHCSGGGARFVTTTLVSIREITPVCATEPSRCSPTNTLGTGEGVEEHTYRAIVDFNKDPLKQFANCDKVIIDGSINARNGAITTGPSGTIYTNCMIDLTKAPCNTSPALTSEPIAILCCDQPFYFNNGALDTANFDSLSYAWANPQRAYNTNTNYSGGFSYLNPFTVYDPRPGGGAAIPNANPPIGLCLDPLTGDIVLTPTNCSEVTVAVIEVTEWRKNDAPICLIDNMGNRVSLVLVLAPQNGSTSMYSSTGGWLSKRMMREILSLKKGDAILIERLDGTDPYDQTRKRYPAVNFKLE